MRTISLNNLKGGVGKTTTAINMAMILAKIYRQRVLIVDNDVQANVTKYFNFHSYDRPSMENIYRNESVDIREIIRISNIPGLHLDVVPANMNMDDALTNLLKDSDREQLSQLGRALAQVRDDYDFCIIDNPPGVGMNILNAIACANDIIVPIKIDKNALDGMQDLVDIVGDIAGNGYNPNLESLTCLITMYCKDMYAGDIVLKKSSYDVYNTRIRYSRKVDQWTFEGGSGLLTYSPRSAACVDYKIFVKEYLKSLPADVRKEVFSYAKN